MLQRHQLHSISHETHTNTRKKNNSNIEIKYRTITTTKSYCGNKCLSTIMESHFIISGHDELMIRIHNANEEKFAVDRHFHVLLINCHIHQLLLLSIITLVLMDILCSAIVIVIEIQLQLHIFIQWIFYDTTRVLLQLLLHLLMKRIEILMDIHVMELTYDLLQVFIYVFEFDYITRMQFLKQ